MEHITELYNKAAEHIVTHRCSAHPYKYADRLYALIREFVPEKILEIGTGIGFSAIVMAKANPYAHITTIEKDNAHTTSAQVWFETEQVHGQITQLEAVAEQALQTLPGPFDFIFFDGYQVHYEFLPHYFRLLNSGGVLVVANNHLKSKTSDHFFAELQDIRNWEIIEMFGDTTVAKKSKPI